MVAKLVLLLACSASALQLAHLGGARRAVAGARPRTAALRLAEGSDGEMGGWRANADGSDPLSAEQLQAAAKAASEPAGGGPGLFQPGTDTSVGPAEGFDPRIILYVSLPAIVLFGQLFFTFSRDALGDDALGPAIMDAMQ